MLQIFRIAIVIMIIPTMCLGFMVGLSGGGLNPTFQNIGTLLITVAPIIGILGVIGSFILNRMGRSHLAYISLSIPFLVWVGLVIWLQLETAFFTW